VLAPHGFAAGMDLLERIFRADRFDLVVAGIGVAMGFLALVVPPGFLGLGLLDRPRNHVALNGGGHRAAAILGIFAVGGAVRILGGIGRLRLIGSGRLGILAAARLVVVRLIGAGRFPQGLDRLDLVEFDDRSVLFGLRIGSGGTFAA